MKRTSLIAVGISLWLAAPLVAAETRPLETALKELLDLVADALDKDVALKGRTISLGRIASERRPDANYGAELRRVFEDRLKGKLVADGGLNLTVDYDLVDSQTDVAEGAPPDKKMKVLQIRVLIKDQKNQLLFQKAAEVNETADVLRVFGLTAAPPELADQAKRNDVAREAAEQNRDKKEKEIQRAFNVKSNTQIGILGADRYFVEILVKDRPDGFAKPVAPTANKLGNAFVDIRPGQFYEIRMHNYDKFDAVARILIDGQDAINRFNADGTQYPGFLIRRGAAGTLKGWFHSTDPKLRDKAVFAFAVKEYGHGSAQPAKALGEVGVITVQFAVAWKKDEKQPLFRSIGRETDKGPGVAQELQLEPRNVGDFNHTIAVRYSLLEK
jgi:hypothetical protein